MNWHELELPPRLAALEKDKRGYPIPYIVFRHPDGSPEFVVNDVALTAHATRNGLCHVCGQKLDPNPWFVGGPGTALLNGDKAVYRDGPLHRECMEYSMVICPHLSQHMVKPVDLAPVNARVNASGQSAVDPTVIPGVPEVFVAVQAWAFRFKDGYFEVPKPFRKTSYWQNGVMMPRDLGAATAKRAARLLLKEMKR